MNTTKNAAIAPIARARTKITLPSLTLTAAGLGGLFLIGYLAKSPEAAGDAVRRVLELCATRLVPSLFVFIAAMNIVTGSGICEPIGRLIGGGFARIYRLPRESAVIFLLGSVGGFPLGAIGARKLHEEGRLTRTDAERLAALCDNTGFGFCVGALGGMLGSARLGLILWCVQMIAGMLVGLAFVPRRVRKSPHERIEPSRSIPDEKRTSMSQLICRSITDAGLAMLKICSFAVFFAVIGEATATAITCSLAEYSPRLAEYISAAVAGLIELTTASRMTSALASRLGLILSAFALGFAGLSVQLQIASVLDGSGIGIGRCLRSKLAQGILSAAITAALVYAI